MNCFVIAAVLSVMATSAHAATFALVPQVGLAGVGATVQWGFTPYLAMSAGYTALELGTVWRSLPRVCWRD